MISGHWRSFHLHITVKMTNTLISGFTFGRMILVKMVNSLAPSILPASSSPSGISLITNFHLPESTLLMLVSALAGKEHIMAAYEEAVKERYRFFSFGDAMMIE